MCVCVSSFSHVCYLHMEGSAVPCLVLKGRQVRGRREGEMYRENGNERERERERKAEIERVNDRSTSIFLV